MLQYQENVRIQTPDCPKCSYFGLCDFIFGRCLNVNGVIGAFSVSSAFLSVVQNQILEIPKIWRRALVVAISKPKKLVKDPESCRPVPLICVLCKILEVLIHTCVELSINPQLPGDQAEFRQRDQLLAKLFCSCKTSITLLRSRRRLLPCLST